MAMIVDVRAEINEEEIINIQPADGNLLRGSNRICNGFDSRLILTSFCYEDKDYDVSLYILYYGRRGEF